MTVTVRSFAKINLGLRIGGLRHDGFHELLTIYQTIGLHDIIRVSVGRGSGIEVQCTDPQVPRDESNTCYRIVEKAMSSMVAKGRVVIEIEKRLPVQGGMGGASSNAVAALTGLERALKQKLPTEERLKIAAEVGSDVPLFLMGGTVLGEGRGERVYPLEDLPATPCVVVTPEVGVSTPRAFAEWDRRRGLKPAQSQDPDAVLKGRSSVVLPASDRNVDTVVLRSAEQPRESVSTLKSSGKLTAPESSDKMNELGQGLSAWLSERYSGAPLRRGRRENPLLELVRAGIKNDFEEVVFPEYPELSQGKSALKGAGARYASLSGSGSTLYGLFASKESARTAVTKLRRQGWTAMATVTLPRQEYWKRMFVG